jgi:hypothetical protein
MFTSHRVVEPPAVSSSRPQPQPTVASRPQPQPSAGSSKSRGPCFQTEAVNGQFAWIVEKGMEGRNAEMIDGDAGPLLEKRCARMAGFVVQENYREKAIAIIGD